MTGPFGACVWEQRKKWGGGFPGKQEEKEGERAGGSEKLKVADLLVHGGSLTVHEEDES